MSAELVVLAVILKLSKGWGLALLFSAFHRSEKGQVGYTSGKKSQICLWSSSGGGLLLLSLQARKVLASQSWAIRVVSHLWAGCVMGTPSSASSLRIFGSQDIFKAKEWKKAGLRYLFNCFIANGDSAGPYRVGWRQAQFLGRTFSCAGPFPSLLPLSPGDSRGFWWSSGLDKYAFSWPFAALCANEALWEETAWEGGHLLG